MPFSTPQRCSGTSLVSATAWRAVRIWLVRLQNLLSGNQHALIVSFALVRQVTFCLLTTHGKRPQPRMFIFLTGRGAALGPTARVQGSNIDRTQWSASWKERDLCSRRPKIIKKEVVGQVGINILR